MSSNLQKKKTKMAEDFKLTFLFWFPYENIMCLLLCTPLKYRPHFCLNFEHIIFNYYLCVWPHMCLLLGSLVSQSYKQHDIGGMDWRPQMPSRQISPSSLGMSERRGWRVVQNCVNERPVQYVWDSFLFLSKFSLTGKTPLSPDGCPKPAETMQSGRVCPVVTTSPHTSLLWYRVFISLCVCAWVDVSSFL